MNLRVFTLEPEAALSTLSVKLEQTIFSHVLSILLSAAVVQPSIGSVCSPIFIDVKCVMKQDAQKVGVVPVKASRTITSTIAPSTPAKSLFIRMELRGEVIKRGLFEVSLYKPLLSKEINLLCAI